MKMILFAAAALITMPAMAQQTGGGGVQTNGGQTKPGTNAGNSAIDMQNQPSTTTMPSTSMPSTTTDSSTMPSTTTTDSSTMSTDSSMNSSTTATTPPMSSSTDYPRCKSKSDDHCRQPR